jgi:hypothetical protein
MMADMRRHRDMTHWREYTDNPIACVYLSQGVCSMDGYDECLGWVPVSGWQRSPPLPQGAAAVQAGG